jgi:hypothetical protein
MCVCCVSVSVSVKTTARKGAFVKLSTVCVYVVVFCASVCVCARACVVYGVSVPVSFSVCRVCDVCARVRAFYTYFLSFI